MADQAMLTVEREGTEVHIMLVVIPDSLDDEDERGSRGVAFTRLRALHFAFKIIKASLLWR